ncbi:MAG: hypothetical protein OHK0031_02900 [Anaerolineales bacterium]
MNAANEKILIVCADPDVGDLLGRQALQPLGYKISLAMDAGSAIRQALQIQPDVIIADLDLPGLSGKDLLVALSSQNINPPVIVTAQKGDEPKVIQAFRLGASDYLLHPIREAEVVSAVERALKQVRDARARQKLDAQLKSANAELQRKVRDLTAIFSVGRAVISITDQRLLFEKLVEAALAVTAADMAWLTLKDEKSKAFLLMSQRKLPEAWAKKINQPLDDGLGTLVAMSAESLSIHGAALSKFKFAALGQAALVTPIKVRQEVIGLLTVARREERPFDAEQQSLLEAIADYASISLVNTRLFRALAESAEAAQAGERRKNEALQSLRRGAQAQAQAASYPLEALLSEKAGSLTLEQKQALSAAQEALKKLNFLLIQQTTQPSR